MLSLIVYKSDLHQNINCMLTSMIMMMFVDIGSFNWLNHYALVALVADKNDIGYTIRVHFNVQRGNQALEDFWSSFQSCFNCFKTVHVVIVYTNIDGESFICKLISHFKLQIVDKNVNAMCLSTIVIVAFNRTDEDIPSSMTSWMCLVMPYLARPLASVKGYQVDEKSTM